MIIRILKKIFSWFKEHKLWSILGALGIGSATAGVGVYESHQAKKTNKKAIAIQQEAINRHEIEYKEYTNGKHGGVYMLFTPVGRLFLSRKICQRLAMKPSTEPVQSEQEQKNPNKEH